MKEKGKKKIKEKGGKSEERGKGRYCWVKGRIRLKKGENYGEYGDKWGNLGKTWE